MSKGSPVRLSVHDSQQPTPRGTPPRPKPSPKKHIGGLGNSDDPEVEELKDRIRFLETANAEMRRLLAGMIERIPELEASPEPREEPETASETRVGGEAPEEERRPWWRRLFST